MYLGLTPAIAFVLGIISSLFILTRDEANIKKFIGTFVLGIIIGCYIYVEIEIVSPEIRVMAIGVGWIIVYALIYQEVILPKIGEKDILVYTLLYWYFTYRYFHQTWAWTILIYIGAIPTLLTLVSAISYHTPGFRERVLAYVWYLIVSVFLMVSVFPYAGFIYTLGGVDTGFGILDAFFTGMIFVQVGVNIFYLYYLIPLPSKHERFDERIREWIKFLRLLEKKYSNDQIIRAYSAAIVLFFALIMTVNSIFQLVTDHMLLNLAIAALNFKYLDNIIMQKP